MGTLKNYQNVNSSCPLCQLYKKCLAAKLIFKLISHISLDPISQLHDPTVPEIQTGIEKTTVILIGKTANH